MWACWCYNIVLSPAQEAETEEREMMRGPEWRNGRVRRMGQSGVMRVESWRQSIVMGEYESVVTLVMRTTGVRWSQQNTRTG